MDIYQQWHIARVAHLSARQRPRRHWSRSEKAAIVQKTYLPRQTVSGVAREHGIPASLLFEWRKHHRDGVLPVPPTFDARLPSPQST